MTEMDPQAGTSRRDVDLDLAAGVATMRKLEPSAPVPARLHRTTVMLLALAVAWSVLAD
jgi:hypothetical protein